MLIIRDEAATVLIERGRSSRSPRKHHHRAPDMVHLMILVQLSTKRVLRERAGMHVGSPESDVHAQIETAIVFRSKVFRGSEADGST